jgi:Tol biopolymer transport system component
VYLFFEHGDYYTVMEIKAIDRAGLDQNWAIARTIQIHGATADTNIIPAELIEDSYALLEPTPEAAATTSNNAFSVGFSSDGSILAFNSDVNGLVPEDQQGVMDPFIYNLENGTFFQVIPTIGGNNRAATSRRVISLSADGRYLLYRLRSNSPQPAAEHYNDVLLRDLSTGKDSRIDFLPLEEALGTGIYPSLSPDGRYLALESVIKDHWQIHLLERSTGRLTLISMADASSPLANGDSLEAVFSADNRYLAFVSSASNLIDGDTRCSETNLNCVDVFLYEIAPGKLERIPAKIQFTMGNPYPYLTVSADARWLAWTELIDPSPIYRPVIRLHDRSTGKTETVWDGMGAYQTGHSPSISNDGRWLAFGALAEYDYGEIPLPDSYPQVYLLDRQTNEAIVVSKDANNKWGNGPSGIVALQQEGWSSDIHISGDGRYVAFSSQAANLLPPGVTKRQCFDPYVVGAYACYDLFVYDRETDELTWISAVK